MQGQLVAQGQSQVFDVFICQLRQGCPIDLFFGQHLTY